ncbi:hypothetical protein JOD45_000638 [Scopulibacillus daqui]|uniref:Group-specific protein n=1 Tax=Scopulibacillus daqui TaxID=1469162 RepID=A0ABS2PXZ4_9BACL|nr:hypothetical protein [Scopulibacillus daqui]MBM7644445.1 hypothetical protein [Scopulibacillus daqui]
MVNKLLVVLAMAIFVSNFFVLPILFKDQPENTATFVGLTLLSIVIMDILREKDKDNKSG